MGFTKMTQDVLNISKLPNSVQGNAKDLKATFDKAGEDIKEAHNLLIDELAEEGAASNIGATSPDGPSTVQDELDKLNDRIHVDFTELEIDLDDELSEESENAVKNKVIAKEVNAVKGNLYTVDRYNKSTVVKGQVSPNGVKVVGNAFQNTWTRVSATEYTAENGDVLTASGSTESTSSYRLYYVVDGEANTSNYWLSSTSSTVGVLNQWIKIKLNNPLNIKKMATYISTASMTLTSAIIQGSNDDEKWDDLYTISAKQTSLTEITLDNDNYYQYYRIYFTGQITSANSGHFTVYEWQTVEYMTKEDQIINNINIPLTSYEVGKIVNIECDGMFSEDLLIEKNIFSQNLNETNKTNGVFADGTILELGDNTTSESLKNIFDGSTSTYVGLSSNTTGTIKITLPYPKKISEMYLYISTNNSFKIKGSKNNEDWVELYNQATSSSTAFQPTLNNTDFYKYYMLEITPPSNGAVLLYEWKIIKYYGGMIETFQNPYLNINNLGAKQINGTIKAGEKYRLIYNGESWDAYSHALVIKRGEYTGDSTGTTNVDLGGRPQIVFVYSTINNALQMAVANDGFTTYKLDYGVQDNNTYYPGRYKTSYGSLTITDTGFAATGSTSSYTQGFSHPSYKYGYIAIL